MRPCIFLPPLSRKTKMPMVGRTVIVYWSHCICVSFTGKFLSGHFWRSQLIPTFLQTWPDGDGEPLAEPSSSPPGLAGRQAWEVLLPMHHSRWEFRPTVPCLLSFIFFFFFFKWVLGIWTQVTILANWWPELYLGLSYKVYKGLS